LSREFSNDSEYYKSATGVFALRWTAPEAIQTLKFSMSTDVWAFGVVLLEIVINGETPLKELTNAEVMVQVQSGYNPPKPERCTSSFYKVMLQCWDMDPVKRPSFLDLIDTLNASTFKHVATAKAKPKGKAEPKASNQSRTQANPGYVGQANDNNDANYVVQGDATAQAEAKRSSIGLYGVDDGAAAPSNNDDAGYVVVGCSAAQEEARKNSMSGANLYAAGDAPDNTSASAPVTPAAKPAKKAKAKKKKKAAGNTQPPPVAEKRNEPTYFGEGKNPAAAGDAEVGETAFGFEDGDDSD